MRAIICDECGKVAEEDQTLDRVINTPDGTVTIGIKDTGKDLCVDCRRKTFARMARAAWNDVKARRKSDAGAGNVGKDIKV
jgi:hypothetical protein